MSLYKPHGRPNYSYSFQLHGHRFSGSTGTGNKREAQRVVEQLKLDAKKKADQTARFTADGPMSFEIAASRFWEEVAKHLANADSYYRFMGWLQGHFGKHQTLDRITDSMVASMVAKRRGEGVANATVNRTTTVPLRGIMMRAKKVWKIPVAEINWQQHMLKEPKESVREASQGEEQALMTAMREDYAPALRFAILTGCRRMEIVDLTWSRIDFFGKTITVTGKGDKTRMIPITTAVYDLLWAEKNNHATAVFTYVAQRTRKHKLVRGQRYPITKEGFKTEWRRKRAQSGVENFRFHDTRHTAATRTLRTGNLKVVQQMLGHENIATTAKYAHAMMDDMRAAMEAANSILSRTHEPLVEANELKGLKK